ncbi:YwmB family TATA-box binding protein [Neobacillus notoginsengisoli]|nr:YwmB family TATA-box binding protein [Neobacillus notoginsengisoli]
MKMNLILSLFAIIGFVMLEHGNKTIVADLAPDLVKLAAALEAEGSLLEEWSVYSREVIEDSDSPRELEAHAARLRDLYPDWDWSITSTGKVWEAKAVSPASNYGREYLQLISTRTPHKANAYIIYKVAGGEWNGESATFLKSGKFKQRRNDIFRGEPPIFSCIKGSFDDRMEKALPEKVSNLMARLNAVETEGIREENFLSISANSSEFADTFMNGINIQIAVRTSGAEKATVTVGTPIITVEY